MSGLARFALTRFRPLAVLAASALAVSVGATLWSADLRLDYHPAAYAVKGAKIVPVSGEPIENGTVVVRDGVITDVGPLDKVEIPFDAEVIEGKGLVVYPGFIDLMTTQGQDANAIKSSTGSGRPINYADFALARTPDDNRYGMTPEYEVATAVDLGALAEERRKLGFIDLLIAPGGAIATGQSALVDTSGLPRREAIVKTPVGLHVTLRSPSGFGGGSEIGHHHEDESGAIGAPGSDAMTEYLAALNATQAPAPTPATPSPATPAPAPTPAPTGRRGGGAPPQYPTALMGVVAHLRQAMLDATNHHERLDYYENQGGVRPATDPALDALYAARTKVMPVWWEANTRDEIHRALDLAEEFGTDAVIVGGREANKVTDRLKARGVPVVLKLDFPDEPKVPTEAEYRKLPIEERNDALKVLAEKHARWQERVGVAKALSDAKVKFAFEAEGTGNNATNFAAQLKKVIAAGLSREAAIDALTRQAAEIAGVGKRLGTIEKGKLGHLVILSGQLGDDDVKVKYVLVDGIKFDTDKPTANAKKGADGKTIKKGERGTRGDLAKTSAKKQADADDNADEKDDKTNELLKAIDQGIADRKKARADSAETFKQGEEFLAQILKDPNAAPDLKRIAGQISGFSAQSAESMRVLEQIAEDAKEVIRQNAESKKGDESKKVDEPKKDGDATKVEQAKAEVAATATPTPKPDPTQTTGTKDDKGPETPFVDLATEFDADRKPTIHTGGTVLIKDATILTVTKGTIPKGSILIRGGKIAAVGPDVTAPEGVTVIDAAGMVAMPGIIDTHSHQAIQGGVNEATLSVVPEVRVKDVVTGDDPGIYLALAGGTTAARLLHGSANTIGGQDAVIKHKPGMAGRDLILKGNPQGVKFALGENVTRRTSRFPNTRMGVEAVIERAFEEGRAYRASLKAYDLAKANGRPVGPPIRRDLRLEALADILDGKIKIHSHCYRSDEILMLLRVATRFGVRVQSLQHVLEGYKVAAEIAAHGASASTFSDWWAYKIEAFDAIPGNAGLLTDAGVSVSIKSDSEELIRHLYLEAAKMVKYGGVSEATALAMITINPAHELGIADRMGSIEVGKDADISLFNAHPFDGFARCELALVDGEVHFQRKNPSGKFEPRPGDQTRMLAANPAEGKVRELDLAISPRGKYAISNATIHPVSGPDIQNGVILINDGKIEVVRDLSLDIGQYKIIDAEGLDVWPGLIDSGSRLGLYEIGSLQETQDTSDSAEYQPELRASIALHPDSELIPVARANGILSTFAQPTGGVIAGQGAMANLDGWVPTEMLVMDKAALVVNVPRYITPNPEGGGRRGGGAGGDPNTARKDRLDTIREKFKQALAYDKVVTTAHDRHIAGPTPDPRMAALVPYAKGEKPVIFRAEGRVEILDALKLTADLKLKGVISGGAEAWKVAEAIKAANVPVIVGGTLRLPSEPTDPYDSAYANPAKLVQAGVTIAIKSGGSDVGTATRNLPYDAAVAVAYGLPVAEALKAVTINPARILGVADQLGSIEPGKRANLVITDGHILQPTTVVKGLFIDGKPIAPESRHTRLYAKYQERLAEVKAGTAPLGLDSDPSAGPAPSPTPTSTPAPAATGGGENK